MADPSATAGRAGRDALLEFAESLGSRQAVDPEVTRHAIGQLKAHLAARFPSVGASDIDDVAAETITRMLEQASIRPQPGAMRYLVRKAEWRMLDLLRGRPREQLRANETFVDLILSDNETVRVLEERATAEAVRDVLADARDAGDTVVFRVATYILDVAQRTGEMPSQRTVAMACGISHTAVAKALRRLRTHFEVAS